MTTLNETFENIGFDINAAISSESAFMRGWDVANEYFESEEYKKDAAKAKTEAKKRLLERFKK